MELFTPGHLIPLLAIAAVLFFGWKQLPDMARSAGRSLRVFRTEIKGLADDDATRATQESLSAVSEPVVAAPPAAAPAPVAPPVLAPPAAIPAVSINPPAPADAPGKSAG